MPYTNGIAVINGVKYRPYIGGVKHTFPYYKDVDFVNYILATGTQYINSGFSPSWDTRVVIDVEPTSVTGWTALFGCRNTSTPNATLAYNAALPSSTQIRGDYFGSSQVETVDSVLQRFTADRNKNVLTMLGKTIVNTESTLSASLPLSILAMTDTSDSDIAYFFSGKLYSCQLYDGDTLIRDYSPCRDKNGIYCLYEKVSGEYVYNSGTGEFTGG